MIIRIVTLICAYIAIINASNQWLLVWNEEFSANQLDLNKWDVEHEKEFCHGSYNQQLQCHTSSAKNVRLIDDVLAITAIKQNHLDKEYTSAQLTSKFGFTYGRIKMRAALPKGYMLRPAIYMIPENASQDWPKNGQIDIMTNIQTPTIASGVHYYDGGAQYSGNNNNEYRVGSSVSLNEFHIYQIEWSSTYIKWFFDGNEYLSIDTNKIFGNVYARNGQPFDHNFKLTFHLGIGGKFFSTFLTEQHVIDWNCSLFIFDYIRIYQLLGTDPIDTEPQVSNASVNSICSKIMTEIRPIKHESISPVWIMIIVLTVAVTVLILIVLVLVFRSKMMTRRMIMNMRSKQESIKSNKFDQYDDVIADDNYEQIPDIYYRNDKYDSLSRDGNGNESRYMTGMPVRQISKTGDYVKTDTLDIDYVVMSSEFAQNKT